jgi:dienelactone hydrolase
MKLLRDTRKDVSRKKATEIDSTVELVRDCSNWDEDQEEDEDEDEDDDYCCSYCSSGSVGCISYHRRAITGPDSISRFANVEVVRVPLHALKNMEEAVPFIAPRHPNSHVCTVIALHCLNVHTPWDGWEQFFAPPELTGTMRVVLVLAEQCSWHDYLDTAALCGGGSAWMDILDMDSMDQTDSLLANLVDQEVAWLNGESERLVLMGMSQGGGQAMLRFLRSPHRLGGFAGSVCHVPTVPHTPRDRDPLLMAAGRSRNLDRPIRLLSGENDCVFPPGLVLRDAARLREVGGYTDVEVELCPTMSHEGGITRDCYLSKVARSRTGRALSVQERQAARDSPDLFFLQRHLPHMVPSILTSGTQVEDAASQ